MTASTVWINGTRLGEYRGGFTPFSFELTKHLRKDADNVLVVQVDSTERNDIPPFGYEIDYMTFGGHLPRGQPAHRSVHLHRQYLRATERRAERQSFAGRELLHRGRARGQGRALPRSSNCAMDDNVIAKGAHTLEQGGIAPGIADPGASLDPYTDAAVYATTETLKDPARHTVSLSKFGSIQLWGMANPKLYTVHVRLVRSGRRRSTKTRAGWDSAKPRSPIMASR